MRSPTIRRSACAAVVAAAICALAAPPAPADVDSIVSARQLLIDGDGESETITLSTVAGDSTRLAVIADGKTKTFLRSDFGIIDINTGAGDDTVTMLEQGVFFTLVTHASTNLGPGKDTYVGGQGSESVVGGEGDDTISPGFGADSVVAGRGNDTIDGGGSPDTIDTGADDDVIKTSSSGSSDTVDAGDGDDRIEFRGSSESDQIAIAPATGKPGVLRIDAIRNAKIDIEGGEAIDVDGGTGGDDVRVSPEVGTGLRIAIAGGEGPDELTGADGGETLLGGPGGDVIDGVLGDDVIDGEDGDDTLIGGRGDDRVRGGAGIDVFECEDGDTVFDLEPVDLARGNCLAPPPADLGPPVVDPGLPGPGSGDPAIDPAPGAEPQPPALGEPRTPALPAGFLGFARPKVQIARAGLKVTLRNTHSEPIRVAVAASEKRGKRRQRYKRVVRTIAPGARATIALKASRSFLRARGKRRATVTVSNTATRGKVTLRR